MVHLLERHAAAMVANRADEGNVDASTCNRVSKAAIDDHLTVRVHGLIQDARRMLAAREAVAVGKLYILVRQFRHLPCRYEPNGNIDVDVARPG